MDLPGEIAGVLDRLAARRGDDVTARKPCLRCRAVALDVRDDRTDTPLDDNFQGYGQTITDRAGGYRFRTIRPVPYPGRTPHIHFAVSAPGLAPFTTQMYIAGEPLNERDGVLTGVRDPAARARLIVPLRPAPEIEPDALAGTFDIVLG